MGSMNAYSDNNNIRSFTLYSVRVCVSDRSEVRGGGGLWQVSFWQHHHQGRVQMWRIASMP